MPVRHRELFGSPRLMSTLGERHVSSKVLVPNSAGKVVHDFDCNHKIRSFASTGVSVLNLKNEEMLTSSDEVSQGFFNGWQLDYEPIAPGDDLAVLGLDMQEDRASPHDGHLHMVPRRIAAQPHGAIDTLNFGTVVVCSATEKVPASCSGGPVVRVRSGRVVGVLLAPTVSVRSPAPSKQLGDAFLEPELALDLFPDMQAKVGQHGVAFAPIGEFVKMLRSAE